MDGQTDGWMDKEASRLGAQRTNGTLEEGGHHSEELERELKFLLVVRAQTYVYTACGKQAQLKEIYICMYIYT